MRDVTPEATATVSDRKIDGFGELMRLKGMENTRFAHLSRAGAFTRGEVLIVNVPGSPKGAVESLEAFAGGEAQMKKHCGDWKRVKQAANHARHSPVRQFTLPADPPTLDEARKILKKKLGIGIVVQYFE